MGWHMMMGFSPALKPVLRVLRIFEAIIHGALLQLGSGRRRGQRVHRIR